MIQPVYDQAFKDFMFYAEFFGVLLVIVMCSVPITLKIFDKLTKTHYCHVCKKEIEEVQDKFKGRQ